MQQLKRICNTADLERNEGDKKRPHVENGKKGSIDRGRTVTEIEQHEGRP